MIFLKGFRELLGFPNHRLVSGNDPASVGAAGIECKVFCMGSGRGFDIKASFSRCVLAASSAASCCCRRILLTVYTLCQSKSKFQTGLILTVVAPPFESLQIS